MEERRNEITEGHIPSLIKKIAVPASVGFFFNTMYNIVDAYFSGFAGTEAVAALSLSFPVFFIIIALGSGVSSGVTALSAHAIGAGNRKEAERYAVQGISFSIVLSVVLTGIGFLVASPLFKMLGASGAYLDFANSYISVIFGGTLFFILVFSLNAILNSVGDSKSFRNFLVTGFFLNFVLNSWFMFGGFGVPAMGLAGIALATVLIQLFGVIYLLRKVIHTGLISRDFFKELIPHAQAYKDIARQGFPASISMMSVSIGFFISTYFVGTFGEGAVAAYGVGTRVQQIALLPLIGLSIAAVTLVGQNNGARKAERVKEVVRKIFTYAFWVAVVGTVFLFFLARPLMTLFTTDTEVVETGVTFLRIVAFIMWPYALLMMVDSILRGLKRPMFSLWMGLSRQVLAPILVFPLFVYTFTLGVNGVWWGLFAITIVSSGFAWLYLYRVMWSCDHCSP
ncbi:MAG: MATE family efflux transporter [Candidatus Taylorbacteria bacterium CG11_big_fil_rev_8_21_14_0_20_46_11]|uniref:MATE family efflux transporter n=1 Tax=Candidatus Taylorbacteria bacterium CG11_big_fil_rev_8_21_14_0_20_46_11 TaxID=1975025 RepID=A0A2H0KBT4_9BACT|nr:MAG: MATE family efflux transporter [Candidatus Taylorbacteria bacterium CG11_big_fil_rev_8_21_14_0_20_46_11]